MIKPSDFFRELQRIRISLETLVQHFSEPEFQSLERLEMEDEELRALVEEARIKPRGPDAIIHNPSDLESALYETEDRLKDVDKERWDEGRWPLLKETLTEEEALVEQERRRQDTPSKAPNWGRWSYQSVPRRDK